VLTNAVSALRQQLDVIDPRFFACAALESLEFSASLASFVHPSLAIGATFAVRAPPPRQRLDENATTQRLAVATAALVDACRASPLVASDAPRVPEQIARLNTFIPRRAATCFVIQQTFDWDRLGSQLIKALNAASAASRLGCAFFPRGFVEGHMSAADVAEAETHFFWNRREKGCINVASVAERRMRNASSLGCVDLRACQRRLECATDAPHLAGVRLDMHELPNRGASPYWDSWVLVDARGVTIDLPPTCDVSARPACMREDAHPLPFWSKSSEASRFALDRVASLRLQTSRLPSAAARGDPATVVVAVHVRRGDLCTSLGKSVYGRYVPDAYYHVTSFLTLLRRLSRARPPRASASRSSRTATTTTRPPRPRGGEQIRSSRLYGT
jgi:hypothetical protein